MSALGKRWKWSKPKEERKQTNEHIERCRRIKIGKRRSDLIGNTFGFKKGQKSWTFSLTKKQMIEL